ncbi:MAG: UDP-N-acetylmuramoyl-tripeptide--D-alanyl-D-alanine ligase [Candidatus Ancillula sp.]|jgi:UDP-N-acetylmuramoyl-tripeptide--D-alanyl-D-alanine ligase|nr:UDP-N-acetylmuramoyl-tripeptide--D-alanyl-D-alanine ligase [Candidatus Ancillula sp.]
MDVSKIVINSKKAFPGCTFIPIRGEKFDGHQFIRDAVENGAIKVVFETSNPHVEEVKKSYNCVEFIEVDDTIKELGNIAKEHLKTLRSKCKVIAITGSVGKTTTKDITATLLSSVGNVVFAKESYNNEIGVPLTIFEAQKDTDYLVLEIGANHVGEIEYLADICTPDIAVLLKIGVAHLGEFGSLSNIQSEKVKIFKNLGAENHQVGQLQNKKSVAIFNHDDANADYIRECMPKGAISMEFGLDDVKDVRLDENGKLSFVLVDALSGAQKVQTDLVGEHNVYNVLAALRITQALGLQQDEMIHVLKTAAPIAQHRMQVKQIGNLTIVDDSYNANPDSMLSGLKASAQIAAQNNAKLVTILGDMLELGDKTTAEHARIGTIALNEIGVAQLIGIGTAWADFGEELDDKFRNKFKHVQGTLEEQKKQVLATCILDENVVLLLKGSCALRLWELGDYIIEYLENLNQREGVV